MFGHVKWFTSQQIEEANPLNVAEWTVVVLILAFGLLALSFLKNLLLKNKHYKKIDKKLFSYKSLVSLAVRLSTAGFLLINAFDYQLIASNIDIANSFTVEVIHWLFITSAFLFILGLTNRVAVLMMVAAYLMTALQTDFINLLEHLEYLAIAGFLWFMGPGRYSLDAVAGKLPKYSSQLQYFGVDVYRIFLGLGLVVLALSEKLLNMSVSLDFLSQYSWNLVEFAGVTDRLFVVGAGAMELLVGLGILLNLLPRVLISVVLMLMTLTAFLLGIEEVYGHLFAVGAVAVFWVYDTRTYKSLSTE